MDYHIMIQEHQVEVLKNQNLWTLLIARFVCVYKYLCSVLFFLPRRTVPGRWITYSDVECQVHCHLWLFVATSDIHPDGWQQKWMQHRDFPGGHPSQYYSGPKALNFRVLMGSGVVALVWPHHVQASNRLRTCIWPGRFHGVGFMNRSWGPDDNQESNVLWIFVLYPTCSIPNSTPSQVLHDSLTSVFLYSQVPHINACHMGVCF
jgi:hypothetical protein